MVHEPDRQLRAGVDLELVVDVLHMGVDRPALDEQLATDLLARQALRDQDGDLDLAARQRMAP